MRSFEQVSVNIDLLVASSVAWPGGHAKSGAMKKIREHHNGPTHVNPPLMDRDAASDARPRAHHGRVSARP